MNARILTTSILMGLFSVGSYAQDRVGRGGDPCESRFKEITADLQKWIIAGGADQLVLPSHVTNADYKTKMLGLITPILDKKDNATKIECTSDKIFENNIEKTCRWGKMENGLYKIRCNSARFLNQGANEATGLQLEDAQYQLVHHEYAGILGIEENIMDSSDYRVSNQIVASLESQVVRKLAVKGESDYKEINLNLSGDDETKVFTQSYQEEVIDQYEFEYDKAEWNPTVTIGGHRRLGYWSSVPSKLSVPVCKINDPKKTFEKIITYDSYCGDLGSCKKSFKATYCKRPITTTIQLMIQIKNKTGKKGQTLRIEKNEIVSFLPEKRYFVTVGSKQSEKNDFYTKTIKKTISVMIMEPETAFDLMTLRGLEVRSPILIASTLKDTFDAGIFNLGVYFAQKRLIGKEKVIFSDYLELNEPNGNNSYSIPDLKKGKSYVIAARVSVKPDILILDYSRDPRFLIEPQTLNFEMK